MIETIQFGYAFIWIAVLALFISGYLSIASVELDDPKGTKFQKLGSGILAICIGVLCIIYLLQGVV